MTELTNERDDFEAWASDHLGQGYPLTMDEHTYEHPVTRWAFKAWQAARRATPSSECALPPLPKPDVCAVLIHGDDGDTVEDCYTTEQVEQIRREAVEALERKLKAVQGLADLRFNEVLELRAQLDEAAQLARQSQEPQGQADPLAAITDKGRVVKWNPIYAEEPWASKGFVRLYAAPAHPVAQPATTDDKEYELHQDDMMVAGASGKGAWKEIQHYAAVYSQDGPVEIYEVTRRKVDNGTATSGANGEQG